MTISRSAVVEYLDEQFSSLAASVGQDSDIDVGYKPDVDNALRRLGKTQSELATATVEDGEGAAYFALAEYYAARRFWRQLGDRVNRSTGNVSFNFTNQLATVKAIMEDAARKCATLGFDVDANSWSIGTLNLDFLEPVATRPEGSR